MACADLLHIPAERVWVEWCEAPWLAELARYGYRTGGQSAVGGRRGALIHSSSTGRRGLIRVFWATGETDFDVLASSMEAYFDFDTPDGEAPVAPDGLDRPAICVFDQGVGKADILRRCFRFRYERTWAEYYANAALSTEQSEPYFRTRPRGSQLGAWASDQSDTLASRAELEGRLAEYTTRFAGKPVPRPPHWTGYRVTPTTIELWKNRDDRLHEREEYTRASPAAPWTMRLLNP